MTEHPEKVRAAIAAALPQAIETAIESYQSFAEEEATKAPAYTPQEFKAHHDACKVAIAHIELLLKLGKIAGAPQEGKVDETLRAQLHLSMAEVQNYTSHKPQ